MLRFHDAVHAGGCDGVASVSLANPFLHPLDDLFDLHRVRSNSQCVKSCTDETAFYHAVDRPRKYLLIQLRHVLGAPLPSLRFRVSEGRLAHLPAFFREKPKPSNPLSETRQRLLWESDRNLDPRVLRNESPYALVIQGQNGQTTSHRFQHLSAKRVSQARENESISAFVHASHFVPGHVAEELNSAHKVETPCVLLPFGSHFTIARNKQFCVQILVLCEGLQRQR